MTYPYTIKADSEFAPVVDVFKQNFADGLEHGASVCAMRDGEIIAHMFGGWADKAGEVPINEDHLFSVYSSGKAAAAIVIAHLAEQDKLGYEQLVSSVWPEFSAKGKGDLTISQAMSHQTGLSGVTNPNWSADDWYDWDKTIRELEEQAPIFEPGSASGYSPVTYGFFAGEIARRTDEYGRHLGEILKQDLCDPHNLDVWLGLPETEHHSCTYMQKPRRLADLGNITPATKAAFLEKWSSPGAKGVEIWRAAQLAGSNCQATTEGLARLMQVFIDGRLEGEQILSEDMVEKVRKVRISGQDQVLPFELNIAAGVMLNYPNFSYGPNPNTVGHSGWGGSCVMADPDAGITFSYAMTRQDNSLMGDPRPVRIIEALYECL